MNSSYPSPIHRLLFTGYRLPITVILLTLAHIVSAQPFAVNVTILVPPPYSPYLQDYLQYENRMVIQLQNLTPQTQSVKLIGSIEGDNGIMLITDENYQPATPITIPPNGFYRIPASSSSRSFFDPDNLDFIGPENLKLQILKDGILPEGTYTICLRAVNFETDQPLSDEAPSGCAILPIAFPTPVQLMLPACENDLDSKLPLFQWTLPGGNIANAALQYDLFIIEWLQGSNPQDLVQLAVDYNAGNAIVRRNLSTPAYQYMVTDPKLNEGATYLWVVRVRDRLGKVLFENNGQSEICVFTYRGEETDIEINTGTNRPDLQIVQTRTQISGKLKYKFPGTTNSAMNNMVPRNLQMETEEEEYLLHADQGSDLGIFDNNIYALADHNYIDAFPVPSAGSNPLKNIEVKLVESWVIVDCNVTYMPQNYIEHRDFFILPNDYFKPPAPGGGVSISVYIEGLAEPGIVGPLAMGTGDFNAVEYNRTLDVDRTDASGNFKFNFTQSTPGYTLMQYPGAATVTMACSGREEEQEQDPFDHPLDLQSNPTDIYYDDNFSSLDVLGNPAQPPGLPQTENMVQRMGYNNSSLNQQAYESIAINGGKLYKVLRLEVNSEFFYSPDLIFWTQPGDTITLPDQVSYVKSFDLDLFVKAGNWVHHPGYQKIPEGNPVTDIDVLLSREKQGLPQSIPMEEGQGLRDYEGDSSEGSDANSGSGFYQDLVDELEAVGYGSPELHDSVSVDDTDPAGMIYFKKLVASHHYLLEGTSPDNNFLHYAIPPAIKLYEIFSTMGCMMNLGINLNSFCNHNPISIRDTVLAFPLPPRVFGRVMTRTNNNTVALDDVETELRRFNANGVFQEILETYSNPFGLFQFSNLPVDPNGISDYFWDLEFSKAGFETLRIPVEDPDTPGPDNVALRPGVQWYVNDVELNPLGHLGGYIKDEDGNIVQAIVRLANGPYAQTFLSARPSGAPDFCGDVNNFGDDINNSTQVSGMYMNNTLQNAQMADPNAARFDLPAQAGTLPLIIIPLSDQYFQDTCMVDVDIVPHGQIQELGYFVAKEKLHRISFSIKNTDGNAVAARVYIDERVRETNALGWAAFRFASAETEYHVRIVPESPYLVPIDSIMDIPVSKEYVNHTFILQEGRKLRVKVIVDYSGSQNQPANPIPIAGATVQTLLSSSEFGDSYIQCITGSDGICTLEGVPISSSLVEVSVWKEDDDHLYIGKTVSVSTNRPLNPPVEIALKTLAGITVKDVWGFPATITGIEFQTNQQGTRDTLLEGAIVEIPDNAKFKTANAEVQIPFLKRKFIYSGQRDTDGRKIYTPTGNELTLLQTRLEVVLFDAFNVQVAPKRFPNGMSHQTLKLNKDGNHGKMDGVVQTELSSFNTSHDFTGKFYLGKTPTDYLITVFRSGMQLQEDIVAVEAGNVMQEPTPGPNDFFLMDIAGDNKPRSHAYRVFEFSATSDSSRSFVSPEAFYIHTILHTDLDDVSPRDLKLQVGKIVVTQDDISTRNNTLRTLDFGMGKYWQFRSTTAYYYAPELGGITASSGYIQTGQVDVPVRDIIITPTELLISYLDDITQLTLAGIKDLYLRDNVNAVLGKGWGNKGWRLTIQVFDGTEVDHNGIIAVLDSLPLLRNQDKLNIHALTLDSERTNMDVDLTGVVRPHDICDFTVIGISTGDNYFSLEGSARLGRQSVRVPGLPPSYMSVKFTGPKHNLKGNVDSEFTGDLRPPGDVRFVFDYSTGGMTRQHIQHRRYSVTGMLTVYDQSDNHSFSLKAILDVDYNNVKLHIIHDGLHLTDSLDYQKIDQAINLGSQGKKLLVQFGLQETDDNQWDTLRFKANMVGFEGVQENQEPIEFLVAGPVAVDDNSFEVDGIDFGIGELKLTYIFATQTFTGTMDIDVSPGSIFMGPVSVQAIHAKVLIDPDGFLISATLDGSIVELFDATVGMLVGSHDNIPQSFITSTMQYAKNKSVPEILNDHELNGFFITGRVDFFDIDLGSFNAGIFAYSGRAEAGIDARVWMDFGSESTVDFGFSALAFAGARVEVTIVGICPWEGLVGTLCLAAQLELLIEANLHGHDGDWELDGRGCGSLSFSGSLCNRDASISGWAEIRFSTDDGIDLDGGLGDNSCSGSGNSSEFSCRTHF